ncbi:MAG: vanadium-dependent haloperoxidase [Pseudomonadota bacterium]
MRTKDVFLGLAIASVAAFSPHATAAPAIAAWEAAVFEAEEFPSDDPDTLRLLAGLFLAMYYAGAEVDDRYDLGTDLPNAEATPDEAAAAAGRAYLNTYFKTNTRSLMRVRRLGRRDDLQALATASAELAYEMATRTVSDPVHYRPFTVPGRYVPTQIPNDVVTAHEAHFAYDPARATKLPAPPRPDSDAYAASYNETKRVGGTTSDVRTEEQAKSSMIYDLQDPHPMIYRIMDRRDLTLFEQARIMAIYNLATEDLGAAQFAGKLHFQSWRPITAIRNGDIDGRDDTDSDPGWTPLLRTPNSSEYPCGHCTFVSATAHLLEVLLPLQEGEQVVILADDIYTKDENRGFEGDLVSYIEGHRIELATYQDYATVGAMSRIYNGAHFRYSTDMGLRLGKDVADAILEAWDGLPEE